MRGVGGRVALAATLAMTLASSCTRYEADKARPTPEIGQLQARFFGVSTVLLSDGKSGILIDGFFTRPPLTQALSKIPPNKKAIDWALNKGSIRTLDNPGTGTIDVEAVLVAHSHFDHALDSGTVALKTGARVVGSESTCRILSAEGFPREKTLQMEDGEVFGFSNFKVRIFRSLHTEPLPIGQLNPPDVVAADFRFPAKAGEYGEGGTYSFLLEHKGRTILVHPSTNYLPNMYKKMNVKADVVFLGIGRLSQVKAEGFAGNYWTAVVEDTGAKLVILNHSDDFTRSLEETLYYQRLFDDVPASLRTIKKLNSSRARLYQMPPFVPIDLLALTDFGPAEPRKSLPPDTTGRLPQTCSY